MIVNDGLIRQCCFLSASHVFRNCHFEPLPHTLEGWKYIYIFCCISLKRENLTAKQVCILLLRNAYTDMPFEGLRSITPPRDKLVVWMGQHSAFCWTKEHSPNWKKWQERKPNQHTKTGTLNSCFFFFQNSCILHFSYLLHDLIICQKSISLYFTHHTVQVISMTVHNLRTLT